MNCEPRNKKGFTIIELVVAIGVLALMASFSGVIFKMSIESHRVAGAHAEIMQKLRAITDQLNADFKGLRKDGEIFAAWAAAPGDPNVNDPERPVRFDRIMFFANGDFQTYHQRDGDIRGNVARISYMLAMRSGPIPAPQQKREKRILARTQHIITADTRAPDVPPELGGDLQDELVQVALDDWHNFKECEEITLQEWKNMLWNQNKAAALSVISGVDVLMSGIPMGAVVRPADANSIHTILCEGVGEFKIQGWHDGLGRWVPEVGPDGSPGDFFDNPASLPGVLYPLREKLDPNYGFVWLGGEDFECVWGDNSFIELQNLLNEEHFDEIPGLGRALKFTFTLYDSKGIIKNGRTFTHIVYLEN